MAATESENEIQYETLPFVMDHVPEFYKRKAEKELKEYPDQLSSELSELRYLANEHKMTSGIDFQDDFLLQFLRHRKHDVDRALKQLVKFIHTRRSWHYLFVKIDFEKAFQYPATKFFTVLPRRCPDGCAIILMELGKWEPEEFSLREFQVLGCTLFCRAIRDPMTQVNGFKIIYDFTNASFKHLRYFTIYNVYQFYHLILESLPGRHKQMYVIFNSLTARVAWAIFKGFASKKLKNRTILKPDPEDLLKHFPPSVLPVHYGGTLKDYHMTDWLRKANEEQDNFTLGGLPNLY